MEASFLAAVPSSKRIFCWRSSITVPGKIAVHNGSANVTYAQLDLDIAQFPGQHESIPLMVPSFRHCHRPLLPRTKFLLHHSTLTTLCTFSAIAQDGICMHPYVVHRQLRIVQHPIAFLHGTGLLQPVGVHHSSILNAASPLQSNFLLLLRTLSTP